MHRNKWVVTHENVCHVVGLSTNVGHLVKCVELHFRLTFVRHTLRKSYCMFLLLEDLFHQKN